MKTNAQLVWTVAATLSLAAALPAWAAGIPAPTSKDNSQQAKTLFEQGKYAEAAKEFEGALSAKQEQVDNKQILAYVRDMLGLGRAQAALSNIDEARKTLMNASAIAKTFNLPKELQTQIEADLQRLGTTHSTSRLGLQGVPQGHYMHFPTGNRRQDTYPDAAEEEFLCKAALDFARTRFGINSAGYLNRQLDYLKFLTRQQRPDEMSRTIAAAADVFSKLPPDMQADEAQQILDIAVTLADGSYPLQADNLGTMIWTAATSGRWAASIDVATWMNRLASALERHQDMQLAQKYFAIAVTAYEKEAPADDPNLAKMRSSLADFYKKIGKNGAALELLELSVSAQSKNLASGAPEALTSLASLTDLYTLTGNMTKSKETAENLIAALNNATEEMTVPFAALMRTADFLAAKGDSAGAEKMYTAALMSLRKPGDRISDWELQKQIKALAIRFAQLGNPEQVERLYDVYIQAKQSALGEPSVKTVQAYFDKADFYLEQDSLEKATQAADAALLLAKRFPAADSKLLQTATLFEQKGKPDIALRLMQSWMEGIPSMRNVSEYAIVDAKGRIAVMYEKQGKHDEAAKILTELSTSALNHMPPALAPAKAPLTNAFDKLIATHHADKSIEMLQSMAQLSNSNYSQPAEALARMSYVLISSQMNTEAATILQLALDLQSKTYGPSSIQVANLMRQYAPVLTQAGDTEKSGEMVRSEQAIRNRWQKQNQTAPGGTSIYKPFAPLSETLKLGAQLEPHAESDSDESIGPRTILHVPR